MRLPWKKSSADQLDLLDAKLDTSAQSAVASADVIAEREADRAALLMSNDQLATLSADLNALVALLRHGKSEQAQAYRHRLETADAEIRRHLDRASALIALP